MEVVSSEWLKERGGLHDARVVDVRWVGPDFEISFDDVWSNLRGWPGEGGMPDGEAPGTLVLEDASLKEGDLSATDDGWVSGIDLVGSEVHLDFFYSPVLIFDANRVHWLPAEQQPR